jgi:hypothetical protein
LSLAKLDRMTGGVFPEISLWPCARCGTLVSDPAFHRFTITDTGITIDEDGSAAEEILAEAAQQ